MSQAQRQRDIAFVQEKYGLHEVYYSGYKGRYSFWKYWMENDEEIFQMYYQLEGIPSKVYSSRLARENALKAIKNYFDKVNLQKIAYVERIDANRALDDAEHRSGWRSMNGTKEKKKAEEAQKKEADASFAVFLAKNEAQRFVNEERNNYPPFNVRAQTNNVGKVPNTGIANSGPAGPLNAAFVPGAAAAQTFNATNSQIKRAKAQLAYLGRVPTNTELTAEIKKVKRFNTMSKRKGGRSKTARSKTRRN